MVSEPKPVSNPSTPGAERGTPVPTLFGEGYGSYQTSKRAFAFSYLGNCAFILLLIWSSHWVIEHRDQIKHQFTGEVTGLVLPPGKTPAGGGGVVVMVTSSRRTMEYRRNFQPNNWHRRRLWCATSILL